MFWGSKDNAENDKKSVFFDGKIPQKCRKKKFFCHFVVSKTFFLSLNSFV
jgi:hypothetical protein